MSDIKTVGTNEFVKARVNPIRIPKDDGGEYVLDFTFKTIKALDERGVTLQSLQNGEITKVAAFIYGSFQKNHKWEIKKEEEALAVWDETDFGDEEQVSFRMGKGFERLIELYTQALEGNEPKNAAEPKRTAIM